MIDIRDRTTGAEGRFRVQPEALLGIALHHSVSGDYLTAGASEADELAQIDAIDAYHVSQDFGGIGYHVAVFASGRVYQLGDLGGARAHVAQRNHELLGLVAIGTFTQRLPAPAQRDGLAAAIRELRQYADRELPVRGHGEWALPGQGTLCPGRLAEIDWTPPVQAETPRGMVRFNGIAAWFEKRELPEGMFGGRFDPVAAFQLPPAARALRLEVALQHGSFAAGDPEYAGRVDEAYGSRLGIIDLRIGRDGLVHYDCPAGTVVERLGCLGYWLGPF